MNTLPDSSSVQHFHYRLIQHILAKYATVKTHFVARFSRGKYCKVSFDTTRAIPLKVYLNQKLDAVQIWFDPDESRFMIFLIALLRASVILTVALLVVIRVLIIALLEIF